MNIIIYFFCVCVTSKMNAPLDLWEEKKKSDAVSESAISQWKRILFSLWFLMVDEWGKINAFKKNQLVEEEKKKKPSLLCCESVP